MRVSQLLAAGSALVAATAASPLQKRSSRTSPPSGCLVVNSTASSTAGWYTTLNAAVAALTGDSACIFIYSGTYDLTEQVLIDYDGALTIYGYTTNTATYADNAATIQWSKTSTQAGSDSLSAAIQVKSDNFSMYNVNVRNTYGKGTQAIAFTAHGDQHGYYGCGFYGYQDTLYAYAGNQYYKGCYIEGAVDYIFGSAGAWFEECQLVSIGPGAITANGRSTEDDTWYVINNSTISAAANVSLADKVYLGRPWKQYARVIFQYSSLSNIINPIGWTTLDTTATPTLEEWENTGAGANTSQRVQETAATGAVTMAQLWPDGYSWLDTTY